MNTSDQEYYIDAAAYQYFRDVADGDYIMARSAFFMLLMPQFFHSAQQAFEKYLKCILVLRRISTKGLGHDLKKALGKLDQSEEILLSDGTKKFILEINSVKTKYLETSYCILGHECACLDMAVWELRRYCAASREISEENRKFLRLNLNDKDTISKIVHCKVTDNDFLLPNGKLEKILEKRDDSSCKNLTNNNAFFGDNRSAKVQSIPYWIFGENTLMHAVHDKSLYDALDKYIQMPPKKSFFSVAKVNNAINSQRIEGAKSAEVMGRIRQEALSGKTPAAMIEERKKQYRDLA